MDDRDQRNGGARRRPRAGRKPRASGIERRSDAPSVDSVDVDKDGLHFLSRAGAVLLGSALEEGATLGAIVRLTSSYLCDACAVYLLSDADGELRRVAERARENAGRSASEV